MEGPVLFERYLPMEVIGEPGSADGQLDGPRGIAINSGGDIYVVEQDNDRVQVFGGPWLDLFIGEPELPVSR